MMRYVLLCSVMCLSLWACSPGIPRDVIPIDKMKFIMYDVLSAQEMAQSVVNAKDTTAVKNKTFELYEQVFAIHKITREDFDRSFKFYEAHPDKIKILFDSVTAFGTRKKTATYMQMR